jgi:hypothetical protein
MMADRAHFAGQPLKNRQVVDVTGERTHPFGQVVPVEVDLITFFTFLLFHQLFAKAGRNHDSRPKPVAAMHENETHGRFGSLGKQP